MFLLEVVDYIAAYDAAVAGGLDKAQMGLTEKVGGELKKTGGAVSPVIARLLARGEQDMAMALFEVAHPGPLSGFDGLSRVETGEGSSRSRNERIP